MAGFNGVLQAQNNLLVHLGNQPDGHSFRLVFDSQRIVTDGALSVCERRLDSSRWATRWTRRADTYGLLIKQSRNLRGLVGTSTAAAEGAVAAHRTVNLPSSERITDRQLQHLDSFFVRIDRRLAEIIRTGASDRSYLMSVGLPRIDLVSAGPVKQQRIRHVPLDVPNRAGLLVTASCRLPHPEALGIRAASAASRRGARSSAIVL